MRQTTSSSSSSTYKWGSTKAKKSSCGVSSCTDWLASLCVCSLKRTKAENISDNVFMLSPADKLYSSHSFSPAPSDMQQQSTEWVIVAYKQKSINCSQTDKWSSTDFLRGTAASERARLNWLCLNFYHITSSSSPRVRKKIKAPSGWYDVNPWGRKLTENWPITASRERIYINPVITGNWQTSLSFLHRSVHTWSWQLDVVNSLKLEFKCAPSVRSWPPGDTIRLSPDFNQEVRSDYWSAGSFQPLHCHFACKRFILKSCEWAENQV